ncbi:MAG: DUF4435 domain-containing protein [Dolichospermum sp. DEX189]|jgi:hypothetical protein|uniref:DUF4435 domain-containing protein n=1 Tax=Aphanizomenon flos-aquae FACHB-1040 TaxID=2692887 RepID=A0ABR8C2U4_APHFL|nr:DUF4435 domain-containing protein [Aphanizomenon flos-aquae]MBD2281172.1 DUF4435 domain-containing protein [Aphanizomenon flos-aquae FACHB-1040]MBO1069414.1 DUF4435 domain-containing protein [Dolichospermum sp. DEX189]
MKDNNYQEIVERMGADAFHNGCDISVLVEDIYDEEFWRLIIENAKPNLINRIYFPSYINKKGTRGKDILKKYQSFVNKKFIICIDSDCEYLYETDVWYIADYIYHTVVYSKENFQCNHFSLNEICKSLTTKNYNFKSLLENISRIVSPLFYVWFYFKEINYNNVEHLINNEAFARVLNFPDSQFDNIGDENILFQNIEDRVRNTLQNLKEVMNDDSWYESIFTIDIPNIQNRLTEQYSIRPEDILSFCCGHGVLDQFVEPFMRKMIDILKTLKIEEVKQDLSEDKNIDNTLSRIENIARRDIKTMLNTSLIYLLLYNAVENKQMQEIRDKLARELS